MLTITVDIKFTRSKLKENKHLTFALQNAHSAAIDDRQSLKNNLSNSDFVSFIYVTAKVNRDGQNNSRCSQKTPWIISLILHLEYPIYTFNTHTFNTLLILEIAGWFDKGLILFV